MNMKQFPILYKRTSTGKVQIWQIETEANKYRVTSGTQEGKKVTSDWTICQHKNLGRTNEVSSVDQAIKEAQAQWDKKQKSGSYYENVEDIDGQKFIKPMLAKGLKDRKDKIDISQGVILEVKLNGMRCIATKDGLFTRTGERYTSVPHIEKSLSPLFKKFPAAVVDGELFNLELREQLNEIAKLIRRTEHFTPEHFEKTQKLVKYYAFDGWNFGAKETDPFIKRKQFVDQLPKAYNYLEAVKDYYVTSWAEFDKIYQSFLDDRHEGAILRIPNAPYERKRSAFLLKIKPTDDAEAVITSIEEGKGNWSGRAKIIGLRMPDGREFNATFKGTMSEAADFLKNKDKWIGKTVTYFYNGFTGYKIPNFAQVDYNNCIKGDR